MCVYGVWSMEHPEDDFLVKTYQGPRRHLGVLPPQCAAQRCTSELQDTGSGKPVYLVKGWQSEE